MGSQSVLPRQAAWNDGIVEDWKVETSPFRIKPIIPTFQHSIVPLANKTTN
jgi:hypothetical protein